MNIVFLDINGVLQPDDTEDIYYPIDDKVKKVIHDLSLKYNIDYSQYSIYDVLPVYYDWNHQSVERLREALDVTNSKIIISSDRRNEKKPYEMRDLLALHNLDKYWYKDNIMIKNNSIPLVKRRYLEIKDSLLRYPISNFVVLDDMKELDAYFPNNSVITCDHMSFSDMNKCIKILKK